MQKTVILGQEFDDDLRRTLVAVMRDMGAKVLERDWSVGGSQELETTELEFRGRTVQVAAETYIGLSITGDENDIAEIADRVSRERNHRAP